MTNITQGFISIGGGSSVSGDSAPPPPPNLGAANFRKDIDLGLSQQTTLVMNTPQAQDLGVSVEQAPAILLTNETLGLSVDTFASGTAKQEQTLGLTQGNVLTMNNLPEKLAGFQIQQTWNYVGTKNVTSTQVIGDSWSNVGNATGAPDGSVATRSGQALSSTNSQLITTHAAVGTTKDPLTIDKVEFKFYGQQSGTTLNNGGMTLSWRRNSSSGWITLETITNDQNFLTTPKTFDVTSTILSFGGWNDIRDSQARIHVVLGLGTSLVTCSVDAVQKVINGSLIE